ncbi:glycoside hydrolase family 127 protein [Mucilaginibacter sabulilitoris]|uniref:Glycoside hydrolase family 127 protein n=1 Tax=Mucilaginibacter sabulilitoris TaxID=1173583 RepID=A0ABZ0TJJ3_9SPHI|nr:glycoside hydrolase family 127 protein [Mucilaginibacter sabulilitoris]WPU92363.1 glycoside hydrolase family 127 protein [Mucilaginibacter sabulilitoris]
MWSKMMKLLIVCLVVLTGSAYAQNKALVNTDKSKFAKLSSVDMGNVTWTNGFWADRFKVCRDTMIPNLWRIYTDPKISHAFRNFEIAAGLDTGSHEGPPFHDGDFYKLFEAVASMYASTHDPKLDALMDKTIAVIAKAQRPDGYIHTPTIIEERKSSSKEKAFNDRLNFETYNLGHLMTAACVHYRATGKTSMLKLAVKATDYLYKFYKTASPELARNAICPSHYMGVVEMYRTTHDPKYLELAKNLINIRGLMENGTDDNQDRIPFRQQKQAMGHAVRANYLFAGVADVYAETGDTTLMHTLTLMWNDVVNRKMYITGGCGSLYDGVSPDGTSYNPNDVQKVHQAYGRDYQLPNFTAHNETCANIGNVLWNWRMLQISGDAKYADVMELALYNSVLSGISLSGRDFLYTNPLSYSDDLPFSQRWSKDRVGYIKLSNCCPPNVVRTISEISDYAYSISDKGLWFNLYGGNTLETKLKDGSAIKLTQTTNYPWDGKIGIKIEQAPGKSASMFFRIPGWSKDAVLTINGKAVTQTLSRGGYAEINRDWKTGDKIELNLPMPVTMMEANPLVEETRNQVAVKRGPVVYCLESADLAKGQKVFNIALSSKNQLQPEMIKIDNSDIMSLVGKADVRDEANWKNKLYKEISAPKQNAVDVRLIPYYAWGNRGHVDMETWIPLDR